MSSTLSVFLKPLTEDLHVSRGLFSLLRSGEIVIGFSTANKVPRETKGMTYRMKILLDQRMNPLYKAAVEATEEAIVDSLCMAEPMIGHSDHFAPALPLERLPELLVRARTII